MISIENSTPDQMQAIGESDEFALTALSAFIANRREHITNTVLPRNELLQSDAQGHINRHTAQLNDLIEEVARLNEEIATWDLI
jgi:hypothetical protein